MQEETTNLSLSKTAHLRIENEHDIYIREEIASIFPDKKIYFATDYPDPDRAYTRNPRVMVGLQGKSRYDFHEIQHMNQDHLQEVKDKKAFLVCEMFVESSPAYMNRMYMKCIKAEIPTEQVILVGSSMDFKMYSDKCADIHKVNPMIIVYYTFFERGMKRELLLDSITDKTIDKNCSLKTLESLVPLELIKTTDPLSINQFKKRFIFLNHMPRPHRSLMLILLNSHDLLKYGYVSFLSSNKELIDSKLGGLIKNLFPDPEQYNKSLDIMNKIPLYVDECLKENTVDPGHRGLTSLHEYVNHSFFHLTSETYFQDKEKRLMDGESKNRFLTEKTFKCIAFKQPFIIISLPGTLEILKKLGYKTFSPWIDESYDTVENGIDRLRKISLEVKRLCELDENTIEEYRKELIPIIEHNYNLLMNRKDFFHYPIN
jgi:hypothetical protein